MAAPSKKANLLSLLRWLLLLPIPLVWCVLHHKGLNAFFENRTIDWRFRFRGELASPVNVIYVDVDSVSLEVIGNQPWSRDVWAKAAAALINEAKVKAVGFDFVFSDAGIAQSVDRRKFVQGNAEFGRFLMKKPPVALAASYAGQRFRDINFERNQQVRERQLPLVATETRRLAEIEPPEIPVFETSPDPARRRPFTPPVAIGLIDTIQNGTRLVPAWAPNNTKVTYYHLSAQLARLYWDLPPEALRVRDGRLEFVKPDGTLKASVPLIDGQMLEVNWFTRWKSPLVAHAEFSDVLAYAEMLQSQDPAEAANAKKFFSDPEFAGAVVLIGPVDPLMQDLAPTSLDDEAVPKVGVHGNLLKTIVSGITLQRPPDWAVNALIFGLTLIVATLSVAGGARALFAKIMAVLALLIYVALAFKAFEGAHLVLPFTAPLGAALTTSFGALLWQLIDEQRAKARVKGMFGAYVSPQLVDQMVETGQDPQLGGHDEEITAYFSDIQGFSTFSEKMKSGPLVELMNEYLTACTDIVLEEGGSLDKYIGDAVVAMFGAPVPLPDHAYRACVATQRVHAKLGELREKWKGEGAKWPEIVWRMQSRIGLNTGVCMVGNMGSRTRFNYTMMGDDVNLAARMESGAKSWGAYTMCTLATKTACEKHGGDRVVFRPLSRLVVKGRTLAVPVFEIVGLKENVTPQTRECLEIFEAAMARYYARDWAGARALFERSRELELNVPGKTPGVVSNPSLIYLEKVIPEMIEEPPADDWDGRYVMKEK